MKSRRRRAGEEADERSAVMLQLHAQILAEAEEAAATMRLLVRRTDRRLWELIWHLDIEPLEQVIEWERALLRTGVRIGLGPEQQLVGEDCWSPCDRSPLAA